MIYIKTPWTETMCHSGTASVSGVVVTADGVGDVGYRVWARPPYKTTRKTYERVVGEGAQPSNTPKPRRTIMRSVVVMVTPPILTCTMATYRLFPTTPSTHSLQSLSNTGQTYSFPVRFHTKQMTRSEDLEAIVRPNGSVARAS
jgi:hypothetical protein